MKSYKVEGSSLIRYLYSTWVNVLLKSPALNLDFNGKSALLTIFLEQKAQVSTSTDSSPQNKTKARPVSLSIWIVLARVVDRAIKGSVHLLVDKRRTN